MSHFKKFCVIYFCDFQEFQQKKSPKILQLQSMDGWMDLFSWFWKFCVD